MCGKVMTGRSWLFLQVREIKRTLDFSKALVYNLLRK